MTEELLTLKEIARRLDLPESNIRYYRDKFEQYLPYTGEGRKRRYHPEAVEVFQYISAELKKNTSCDDIMAGLSRRFSQNPQLPPLSVEKGIDNPMNPSDFSQLFESQARALEHLCEILNRKETQAEEIKRLHFGYRNVKKALISLWNKNKALEAKDNAEEEIASLRSKISSLEEKQALIEQVLIKQSRMLKHLFLQQQKKDVSPD